MKLLHREVEVQERFRLVSATLNERSQRAWAGAEAKVFGWGGVRAVARACGMSVNTVRRGMVEVEDPSAQEKPHRIRRCGGGRKAVKDAQPKILEGLEALVSPATRGDPQRPLLWTCKSVRNLAEELGKQGFEISAAKTAELLHQLGYSLQSQRKRDEGKSHPDRDAQFTHINEQVVLFQTKGQPVISVDTKKKELVGNYRNQGREWRPKGDPEEVKVYDFVDKKLGRAIPYGVYDMAHNEGWVSVGCDHDTAEFAVESIRRWWRTMGQPQYPQAHQLLITADGGGSNGSRCRLWKWSLQQLSNQTGLEIAVCHFPPATSKWNKIEHRMFTHITQNWRGRALVSHEVVVELISSTTTRNGLKIKAERDEGRYEKGKSPTLEQLESMRLTPNTFHGEWNYTIRPQV
jgi:transposase